jgi:hypothetical protein
MTPARREIFVRLIKVIVANIRYEKHCIRDHDAVDSLDPEYNPGRQTRCPRGEHERDLITFQKLLADTVFWFKNRRFKP